MLLQRTDMANHKDRFVATVHEMISNDMLMIDTHLLEKNWNNETKSRFPGE